MDAHGETRPRKRGHSNRKNKDARNVEIQEPEIPKDRIIEEDDVADDSWNDYHEEDSGASLTYKILFFVLLLILGGLATLVLIDNNNSIGTSVNDVEPREEIHAEVEEPYIASSWLDWLTHEEAADDHGIVEEHDDEGREFVDDHDEEHGDHDDEEGHEDQHGEEGDEEEQEVQEPQIVRRSVPSESEAAPAPPEGIIAGDADIEGNGDDEDEDEDEDDDEQVVGANEAQNVKEELEEDEEEPEPTPSNIPESIPEQVEVQEEEEEEEDLQVQGDTQRDLRDEAEEAEDEPEMVDQYEEAVSRNAYDQVVPDLDREEVPDALDDFEEIDNLGYNDISEDSAQPGFAQSPKPIQDELDEDDLETQGFI